jgi:hypothetical protein
VLRKSNVTFFNSTENGDYDVSAVFREEFGPFRLDEVIFMTGLQPPTDCNHL